MKRSKLPMGRTAWSLGLLVLSAACTYVDTDRPGPPVLDDPPTLVRRTTVELKGFAEPGATVRVTRDPSLDAAVEPVKASEYTGVFRFAGLPLTTSAPNRFTFTATDPAGNISDAVEVTIEASDRPDGITLQALRDVVVAGADGADGKLEVIAELVAADDGLSLAERPVTFTLAGLSTATQEATTDASGRAQATFTGLTTPGAGTVTVNFGGAGGTPASRPVAFRVVAGPVAQLTLALAPAGETNGVSSLRVVAGDEVDLIAVATDANGNVVEVPVSFAASAPGSVVLGRRLSGLAKAGTYEVVAAVEGVATQGGAPIARATLEVSEGAAKRLLVSAPESAVAGEPAVYALSLTDESGNAVALPSGASFAVESTLPAEVFEVDLSTNSLVVRRAGAHRFTASVVGASAIAAVEFVIDVRAAAPSSVDVVLTGTDIDPATPAVIDVVASSFVTLGVALTVRDSFRNVVAAPVVATVDGGVLFDGSSLRRLVTAGTFEVVASVPGSLAGGSASFTVRAAPATALRLTLDRASILAGETVRVSAGAVDGFGNVASEPTELIVDGLVPARYTADLVQGTLTVRSSGSQVVRLRALRIGAGVPAAVTAPLVVAAAQPSTLTLSITPSNDVRAGEVPNVALTALDAFSNTVAAPAVRWSVVPLAGTVLTGAGPVVSAGQLLNLVRPGRYRVSAAIEGTAVATDPADIEGEVRVTAAAATDLGLRLEPDVIELGGHTNVTTWLRDAYGNTGAGTVAVQAFSGTALVANSVGATFVPQAVGTYSLVATATLAGGDVAPTPVTRLLSVLVRPDTTPPVVAFQRPAGDPTIGAWPPPGAVTPNRCVGNAGDVASLTISDAGRVATDGLWFGGLVTSQPDPSETGDLAFPMSPVVRALTLCNADVVAPPGARGEVLVNAQAVDAAGNATVASGSWCLDPTASAYLPTAGDIRRCATVRGASFDGVRGLAADAAGDLAVVRDAGAGAELLLYTRSAQPYGLGTARPLPGSAGAPGQVAFSGRVAFTSLASASRSLVVRTRGLTSAGGGFDDEYAVHTSATERIAGVALGDSGNLYATVVSRDAAAMGGRLVRFGSAFDFSTRFTALPSTSVVTSTTARPEVLCAGAASNELFAAGSIQQGATKRAALLRVTLDAVPVEFVPAWVDTETGRTATACATVGGSVAVTVQGPTSGTVALVNLGTAALVAPALLSAYGAAPEDAVASVRGLVRAGSYLFFASDDGATGSLVRFARDGGY